MIATRQRSLGGNFSGKFAQGSVQQNVQHFVQHKIGSSPKRMKFHSNFNSREHLTRSNGALHPLNWLAKSLATSVAYDSADMGAGTIRFQPSRQFRFVHWHEKWRTRARQKTVTLTIDVHLRSGSQRKILMQVLMLCSVAERKEFRGRSELGAAVGGDDVAGDPARLVRDPGTR